MQNRITHTLCPACLIAVKYRRTQIHLHRFVDCFLSVICIDKQDMVVIADRTLSAVIFIRNIVHGSTVVADVSFMAVSLYRCIYRYRKTVSDPCFLMSAHTVTENADISAAARHKICRIVPAAVNIQFELAERHIAVSCQITCQKRQNPRTHGLGYDRNIRPVHTINQIHLNRLCHSGLTRLIRHDISHDSAGIIRRQSRTSAITADTQNTSVISAGQNRVALLIQRMVELRHDTTGSTLVLRLIRGLHHAVISAIFNTSALIRPASDNAAGIVRIYIDDHAGVDTAVDLPLVVCRVMLIPDHTAVDTLGHTGCRFTQHHRLIDQETRILIRLIRANHAALCAVL